ncbi:acyl transferase/acyl hydrolase/lysophospholipase [Aspergillus pseudotamarii]|uniref:Acyl transferase/acyl hydrolase/lysophospholipase n=1 Tax=Aspergillus pseudotamarii TaxID=132259 RepID=A0A5N6T0D8_ASPPS|nr:acyl transferase/acyl hydrolase/lysophospholipase [Aspergillus pseudotamarii]KAE8139580.1 acyl transferase/acyl hydrolase/lysophospholipase [Aspergillus pseudotamarii]
MFQTEINHLIAIGSRKGMFKELLARYAISEKAMERADQYIKKLGAEFSIVTIELSLTQLLKSWGMVPIAVVGHSSGEIAAPFAAGMFDVDDYVRGSRMAIGTCKEGAERMIKHVHSGTIVVASINSDSSVTVSGDTHAIDELRTLAEDQGLFNQKLRVDVAYHSYHMNSVSAPYPSLMGDIRPQESSIKFYSSMRGHQIQSSELNANYWASNLLSPVNFVWGLSSLLRGAKSHSGKPVDTPIEIGPHPALEAPTRETAQECASVKNIKQLPCLKKEPNVVETMQQLAVPSKESVTSQREKETENEVLDTLETQEVEEEELHALLAGAISGKMPSTCNRCQEGWQTSSRTSIGHGCSSSQNADLAHGSFQIDFLLQIRLTRCHRGMKLGFP